MSVQKDWGSEAKTESVKQAGSDLISEQQGAVSRCVQKEMALKVKLARTIPSYVDLERWLSELTEAAHVRTEAFRGIGRIESDYRAREELYRERLRKLDRLRFDGERFEKAAMDQHKFNFNIVMDVCSQLGDYLDVSDLSHFETKWSQVCVYQL